MYYFDHLSFPIYVLHIFSSQTHSGFSHTEFDVVLSYYAEDIDFVARYLRNTSTLQNRSSRIIVYNKNIRINTTYLHHIIDNYNTLANHILFSQAGVEGMTSTGLSDWKNNSIHQLDICH